MQNLTLVKVGGKVVENQASLDLLLNDFAQLPSPKILVHGGGNLATQMAEKMQIPTQMHEGRRITDSATLQVVTMVYAGLVNKNIVAQLQAKGGNALGLTGADLNLIKAEKRPVKTVDYGWVGDVKVVNIDNLTILLNQGIVPIIAPLTHDGKGQILNTNADTIASELAVALSKVFKVSLLYCFEKNGVLQDITDENSFFPQISSSSFEDLKQQQIIHSGMLPKLENSFQAIQRGVSEVWIGKAENLLKAERLGTLLI